jgi:hypothetical protein
MPLNHHHTTASPALPDHQHSLLPSTLYKMQTFGRLLSVLTFLLSLGFIAQALPAPVRSGALSVRQYSAPTPDSYSSGNNYTPSNEGGNYSGYDGSNPSKSDVLALVLGLKADLDPKLALLGQSRF